MLTFNFFNNYANLSFNSLLFIIVFDLSGHHSFPTTCQVGFRQTWAIFFRALSDESDCL